MRWLPQLPKMSLKRAGVASHCRESRPLMTSAIWQTWTEHAHGEGGASIALQGGAYCASWPQFGVFAAGIRVLGPKVLVTFQ